MAKVDQLVKKNENAFEDTVYLRDDSAMFHTCCNCKSRHVFVFRVVETETGDKGIAVDIYNDELGTELRRFYERERKRKK